MKKECGELGQQFYKNLVYLLKSCYFHTEKKKEIHQKRKHLFTLFDILNSSLYIYIYIYIYIFDIASNLFLIVGLTV
jgi:hypothetical protein